MKRLAILSPFILLTVAATIVLSSVRLREEVWLGWSVIGSFIGCLAAVPVLSKVKLSFGYAALLFPFVVLSVLVMASQKRQSTVTATITDEKIEWTDSPTTNDLLRAIEQQMKPNKQPGPPTTNPPPSATKPAPLAHP